MDRKAASVNIDLSSTALNGYGVDDDFQVTLNTQAPLPATAPTGSGGPAGPAIPLLDENGNPLPPADLSATMGYTKMNGSGGARGTELADGTQKRVWASLPDAPGSPTSFHFLKTRKATAGGSTTSTYSTVILTIPEDSSTSNSIDLFAKRLPSGNGTDTEAMEILSPLDMDVMHPATGLLGEELEDTDASGAPYANGGLVALKRNDNTPKTRLLLRRAPGLPAGSKFRININYGSSTGRLGIWKAEEGTVSAMSGTTSTLEFPSDTDTPLLLDGSAVSARNDIILQQQVKVNNTWYDGDKVSVGVVMAEISVVLRCFIPHAWTSGELPIPVELAAVSSGGYFTTAVVYSDCVGGNRTNYSLQGYEAESEFKLSRQVVMTPYPQLHRREFLNTEEALKAKTTPFSNFYDKTVAIPAGDQNKKFGEIFVGNQQSQPRWRFAPDEPEGRIFDWKRYKDGNGSDVTVLSASVSGGIGHAPFVPGPLLPNIDYEYRVYMTPLPPSASGGRRMRVDFQGEHNHYPAYEAIIQKPNQLYEALYQVFPNPSTLPGPISLNSLISFSGTRDIQ